MENFKWYAVRVGRGKEEKVKATIEKMSDAGENQDLIRGVHAPFQRVYVNKNGKKEVRKRYFSYIVLETDMKDARTKKVLLGITGIVGFVSPTGWGPDHEASPLSEREVVAMLGSDALAGEMANELEVDFKKGEEVRVIEGPFRDKTGRIEALYQNSKKVEVIITVFAKDRKVELNFNQIEKK